MQNTETNKKLKAELSKLAADLVRIGLHTGDPSVLTIGNTIDTILNVGSDRRGLADLSQTLSDFCIRQIKREQGMTDAELAIDELLSQKCNLN